MTFSQDGNQRTNSQWTYYLYDGLDRLTEQGVCPDKSLTSRTVHIVNHYDGYDFVGTGMFAAPEFEAGSVSGKGLLTGSVAYGLNVAGPVRTVFHYDNKGRVVKETASNGLNGFDTRVTTYSFTDKPLTVTHTHTASGKEGLTEVYTYTYDHADRLSSVKHRLNDGTEVVLANYTYDDLGRIQAKKLHNSTHTTSYAYNVRGWTTGITNGNFTQSLTYNNGTAGFNGNITAMTWTAGGSSHNYAFTYDGLNRMLNATHDTNAYTEKVTGYDKNGNITGLQRYGNGLIDNLTYTYNGNRLTKVEDATGNATGFTDGASQANEYSYDNNGNLTQDLNKGITNISYNYLNLPQQIRYSNGVVVNYGYSADGVKQRVQHLNSGLPSVVYCGNVIYEGDVAKLLLTEEGYIDLANGNAYYYYLKDHQGNNRVALSSSGTVIETNHYYPFGLMYANANSNIQPYKYNGKELDTKNGLNWYDYGARHYDAALGRWHVMDPKAEKDYFNSPYNYCGNNPIIRVDKDGKIWETVWDLGNVLYDVGAAVVSHISGDHEKAKGYWVDAGVDAVAIAVPGLPAGLTKLKYTDEVVDAAKVVDKVDETKDAIKGVRRRNRLPDKGEPNTIGVNEPGTTMKKYGPDGNVQKEYNKGHGKNAPKNEQKEHIHDYKPNPNNPSGRGDRQPGRPLKKNELEKDFKVN